MNADDTKNIAPKTIIMIKYGSVGTQLARVVSVTKSGAVVVDRFVSNFHGKNKGAWHVSGTPIKADKVVGLAPLTDPRLADAQFTIDVPAIRAR